MGEARTKGMLGALELVKDKATGARFDGAGGLCRDLCVAEAGLVMRAVGETMIVSPPLVITEAELDELAARARRALDLTRFFHLEVEYWPILDPTGLGEEREQKLTHYRQARDQIRDRILTRFGPPTVEDQDTNT